MSVSNEDIKNMLLSKGIVLSTSIKFSQMRDEHGSLTRYKNGDRFAYCQPFQPSIPRQQKVGDFKCLVYHHGKNNYECRSCALTGHKAGDEQCPAKAEEDSILAFSGYQHPMSNHYLTPIVAFDQDEPFKSIEHAFFWKMALDFGQEDLAARIKKAVHAGVVKQLSKEMEETARYEWEDENTGIMKDLIIQKAKTCEEFRNCLLMNQDKVLAESTHSKRWGTGLSKWLTEQTKPNFWPGMNLLGVMMMELTGDELLSYQSQASGISPATDHIQQDSQCTTSPESDDGSQEKIQTEGMDTTHTLSTSTHSSPQESQSTQRQGRSSTRDNEMKSGTTNRTPREKAPARNSSSNSKPSSKSVNTPKNTNTHKEASSKGTAVNQSSLSILNFFDPVTGKRTKRKILDTAPEKNEKNNKVKKGNEKGK